MTMNLCSSCILRTQSEMLTGYCMTGKCDMCGNIAFLAITKLPLEQDNE